MAPQLFLIDGTAPFFAAAQLTGEVNWSKAPFRRLETNGRLSPATIDRICAAFTTYVAEIKQLGYNGITLDDLAHLVPHSFYPQPLLDRINDYQHLFDRLLHIAADTGVQAYITTDIMFSNEHIEHHVRGRDSATLRLFARSIRRLLKRFPTIAGIIVRLGESDGVDVESDFHSRLVIRSIRQCRRYIRSLIPLFERFDRQLIVRTWTLGAFEIGDLMWNERTCRRVFGGVESRNLIVSHKFGETDFFRYLNLNPLFHLGSHQKMIELQTRREYEGFGEFPSFVGFDYERYARYLSDCDNVVGICAWCQTGGWSHFTRLAYLDRSSIWTELNTFVTVRLFKDRMSAEEAIIAFAHEKLPTEKPQELITLLRLADQVIKELWYIPEFSSRRTYFRRMRVPPLLWVFWDHILINHTLRKVVRRFVHERKEAIHDGYRMLHKIRKMKAIAQEIGIDTSWFDFQYDTFRILAVAREYYLGRWDASIAEAVERLAAEYHAKYPEGFHVDYNFSPVPFKKWMIKTIFKLSLRPHPHYRLLDKLVLIRFAGLVYPVFHWWQRHRLPRFAREQAMGVQVLFK